MRRMLTFVTTLAFVALFAMPAQAQEKSLRVGLQGGVTSSNLSGDDVESGSTSAKTGFFAGGYLNYFLSDNFSLGLELNWLAGLGAKSSSDDSETKLSYFSFPVSLNAVLPLGEKMWAGLGAGIAANLRLTCDVTIGGSSGSTDCKDDTESVSWSVPLGAGLGYMMSDTAVLWLGARYQLGLSDVVKDASVKLNWWEFVLGVGFPTG